MKVFEYLVIACGVIILLFTAFLVFLNWNQEIKTKILSSFLVGVITIFALIFWSLKESKISDAFKVSIAVNNKRFLATYPTFDNSKVYDRQMSFVPFASPKIINNGKEVILFDEPKNFEEASKLHGEILQYLLLKGIIDAQTESTTLTKIVGGTVDLEKGLYRPFRLTNTKIVLINDIGSNLSSNKFFNFPFEKTSWEFIKFRFPTNTQISFHYRPTSANSGPEQHSLVIKKTNYFTIIFSVTPLGAAGKTAPNGLHLTSAEQPDTDTYSYLVDITATFDKYTAGSWQTEEYKKWTQSIIDFMKNKLSNESMIK